MEIVIYNVLLVKIIAMNAKLVGILISTILITSIAIVWNTNLLILLIIAKIVNSLVKHVLAQKIFVLIVKIPLHL